jgi:hypothetical protein
MKTSLISVVASAIAGVVACAAESGPELAVCVQNRAMVNSFVMAKAESVVTVVFAEVGLQIDWLPAGRCRNTASNVLRLQMDSIVPAHFGAETLAYALPYGSGTTIHVFYDRIIESHRELGAEVLGYVMAHEIGHVLEGIARHSPSGLMKAHWGLNDYARMKKRRLSFSAEDLELMLLHLKGLSATAAGLSVRSGRE